jgi:ATP-dependent helicase HepA
MVVKSSPRGTFLGCARFPSCRGSRDVFETVTTPPRTGPEGRFVLDSAVDGQDATQAASATDGGLEVDCLVTASGQPRARIGVIREVKSSQRQVAFIDIPERHEVIESHDSSALRRAKLPRGTTVWVRTRPFGFQPGTIRAEKGIGQYLVQLSIGKREEVFSIDERLIIVRDGSEFHHAVEALAVGLVDHFESYRARVHALRSFVRQRAACRGFTSALSGTIRPFKHQVNVLAQVMSDTVRRYVLADEVGLGKTIEAGLIIRQLLSDDPKATVLVSVPPTLIGQWQQELTEKLLLGGPFTGRWRVVTHEDLSLAAIQPSNLLVVDEAHRLAEAALASEVEATIVETVAAVTPGLLLLTATPIRGNAEVFHYLLHLIDPVAHPKDDFDGFRTRLTLREQLAQSIELLVDLDMPWDLVDETLDEFALSYPQDEELQALLRRAKAVGPDDTREPVVEVATYLRETYRLSRRVIRNRRSAVPEFPTTGRQFEDLVVDDPAAAIIDEFLERWRDAVQDRDDAVQRFSATLDAALAGPTALLAFLGRLQDKGLNDDERHAVATLSAQLEHVGAEARLDGVTDWLARAWSTATDQIVVATSYEAVARELAKRLERRVGPKAIALHLESMDRQDADAAVQGFLDGDRVRVLIIDRSAEEGRNLQEADRLLHLDIPLSVNRLEQRIGRVDRFGSAWCGQRKQNVAVRTNSLWEQARDELHRLVGVRDHSVATLQRPLAELEEALNGQVLQIGMSAIKAVQDGLSDRLNLEREEIDRLEELEAFAGRDGFTAEQFERLEDLEEDWGDIQNAVDRLTDRDFGLYLTRRKVEGRPGVFEYTAPGKNSLPRIPQDRLEQLAPRLRGYRTFSRPIAGRNPGVQLVRMGDPLVDWLESFIRTDERGRARAMLRHCPGLGSPQLWFQFDVLVETSVPSQDPAPVTVETLRRIGDGYLSPQMLQLWSDGRRPPEADFKVSFLTSIPPGSTGDVPLYGDRWSHVLEWFPGFAATVEAAWEELAARVRRDARTRSSLADALTRLGLEFDERKRTLQRVRSVQGLRAEFVEDELSRLRLTRDQLVAGIENPSIRCIAAGAYVLADKVPA